MIYVSVDVMNAAWGTMLDCGRVALNLTETHRTVENIKRRKGFVVHIADAAHVVEADWFGVVSGKTEKDFGNLYRLTDTGAIYRRVGKFCDTLILTDGVRPIRVFTPMAAKPMLCILW